MKERIAMVCADEVSIDEARSAWEKYEPGLLSHLGGGAGLHAELEGLSFLLLCKNWEGLPQFDHLVGKAEMVCFVRDAGSVDRKILTSIGCSKIKLDRILAVAGSVPPIGWVFCMKKEQDGSVNNYWVDPTQLKLGEPRSQLTDEQIKVVKFIANSLTDVDKAPHEKWVYDLSCNENPENEINIFSRIAHVIEKERPYRKGKELKEVYAALVRLSSLPDDNRMKHLMSSMPSAKGIRNLDRVLNRWESTLIN